MSKKEFTKKQLRKQLTALTESKGNIKSELKGAYKALKKLKQTLVGHKSGDDTLTFTDLKKIKNAARNIEDIYEDMVDTEMDDRETEKEEEVEKKNEQSEGHGKMYNALSGIKEGKVIKMNESTLKRIVERVISEQTLPRHIRKGSEEHADWIRSQQSDGSDEILESLLSVSQRLTRFVEDTRDGGSSMEDLRDIQKDVVYQITQYLGTTEGRG